MASKTKAVEVIGNSNGKCEFCGQGKNTKDIFNSGKFYRFGSKFFHYFCVLFSSRGVQRGQDEEGLFGFYLSDVKKELKRGARLQCAFCKNKGGATIKCRNSKCNLVYHFPCGYLNKCMFFFMNEMTSACPSHLKRQTLEIKTTDTTCLGGCSEKTLPSQDCFISPCCGRRFHTRCLQQMALHSGKAHYKCPVCSNKIEFQQESLQMGLYIPVQDASWENSELENFYNYTSMGRLYQKCDAVRCLCSKGREHHMSGTPFEIIRCLYCGCRAIHIKCGKLKKSNPDFICSDCSPVVSNKNATEINVEDIENGTAEWSHSDNEIENKESGEGPTLEPFPIVWSETNSMDVMDSSDPDDYKFEQDYLNLDIDLNGYELESLIEDNVSEEFSSRNQSKSTKYQLSRNRESTKVNQIVNSPNSSIPESTSQIALQSKQGQKQIKGKYEGMNRKGRKGKGKTQTAKVDLEMKSKKNRIPRNLRQEKVPQENIPKRGGRIKNKAIIPQSTQKRKSPKNSNRNYSSKSKKSQAKSERKPKVKVIRTPKRKSLPRNQSRSANSSKTFIRPTSENDSDDDIVILDEKVGNLPSTNFVSEDNAVYIRVDDDESSKTEVESTTSLSSEKNFPSYFSQDPTPNPPLQSSPGPSNAQVSIFKLHPHEDRSYLAEPISIEKGQNSHINGKVLEVSVEIKKKPSTTSTTTLQQTFMPVVSSVKSVNQRASATVVTKPQTFMPVFRQVNSSERGNVVSEDDDEVLIIG